MRLRGQVTVTRLPVRSRQTSPHRTPMSRSSTGALHWVGNHDAHLSIGGGTLTGAAASHRPPGSAIEHVPALCVKIARPRNWANHSHIPGCSPGSVQGVATTPSTHIFQHQGTNFHGAGDGYTSSQFTCATHNLPHSDVARLQTCMYECHQQLCHVFAWPALATKFHRLSKGGGPATMFIMPRPHSHSIKVTAWGVLNSHARHMRITTPTGRGPCFFHSDIPRLHIWKFYDNFAQFSTGDMDGLVVCAMDWQPLSSGVGTLVPPPVQVPSAAAQPPPPSASRPTIGTAGGWVVCLVFIFFSHTRCT